MTAIMTKTPLKNKSLIIFDWDGTLMDSIGLIVESLHAAGDFFGYSITDEQAKSIIGLSLEKAIEILFPQANSEQSLELINQYINHYNNNAHTSPLFEGVEQMIDDLHKQGKQLAVATGKKRRGLEQVFTDSGIKDYFISSRCADESGSKPDPAMLNEILAELNVPIEQAVFIGDSIHDINMGNTCANGAGMDTIAVTYGCETAEVLAKSNPTYQVDSVGALAELLV